MQDPAHHARTLSALQWSRSATLPTCPFTGSLAQALFPTLHGRLWRSPQLCNLSSTTCTHMKMYTGAVPHLPRQTLRFHLFRAFSWPPVPGSTLWVTSNTLACRLSQFVHGSHLAGRPTLPTSRAARTSWRWKSESCSWGAYLVWDGSHQAPAAAPAPVPGVPCRPHLPGAPSPQLQAKPFLIAAADQITAVGMQAQQLSCNTCPLEQLSSLPFVSLSCFPPPTLPGAGKHPPASGTPAGLSSVTLMLLDLRLQIRWVW
jgi:hypothetical protein